jgi:hypothetical protein
VTITKINFLLIAKFLCRIQATSSADQEEINRLLRKSKVHCRAHKSPPLVPILSLMNPVHILIYFISLRTMLLSYHLHLGLTSILFRAVPIKSYMNFFMPRAMTPAALVALHLQFMYLFRVYSFTCYYCYYLKKRQTKSDLSTFPLGICLSVLV